MVFPAFVEASNHLFSSTQNSWFGSNAPLLLIVYVPVLMNRPVQH
ncbi:unnamed protein product [Victoria cruziana]